MNFFKNILGFSATETKVNQVDLEIAIVNKIDINDDLLNRIKCDFVVCIPSVNKINGFEFNVQTLFYSIHSKKELKEEIAIPLKNEIEITIQQPLSQKSFLIITNTHNSNGELKHPINFDFSFPSEFTIENEGWCDCVKEAITMYKSVVAEKYESVIKAQKEGENNPIKEYPLSLILNMMENICGFTIKSESFNDIYNGNKITTMDDLIHTKDLLDITVNGKLIPGWTLSKMIFMNEYNIVSINDLCGILISNDSKLQIQEIDENNIVSLFLEVIE